MKILSHLLMICTLSLSLFNSCDNSTVGVNPENSNVDDLLNHEWELYAVRSEDGNTIQYNSQEIYKIVFIPNDTLGGIVDCNIYATEYTAKDMGEIQIGPMISMTEVYCGEESYDDKYIKALLSSNVYEVSSQILKLGYGSKGILFFKKN